MSGLPRHDGYFGHGSIEVKQGWTTSRVLLAGMAVHGPRQWAGSGHCAKSVVLARFDF